MKFIVTQRFFDERTYYEECERNPQFAQAASRARARRVPETLEVVRKAAQDDWRAGAEYLKLSHRLAFAQQLEVSQSEPLKISLDFGSRADAGEAGQRPSPD